MSVTPSPRGSRNKQYCAQHRQHESHKQRAITHSSPEPTAASSSLAVLFSPLSLSPAAAHTCRAATVRPELDSRNQTRWLSADGPRLRRASVCSPATVTIRQRASALLAKPMNGINAPQRPDCVADDAVSCEPVSAPNSLLYRLYATTRNSSGEMIRKLSVIRSRKRSHFLVTVRLRKRRIADLNCAKVS